MSSVSLASLRFLIIDDEAFMRTFLSKILTGLGARDITACADGKTALERIAAGIDVILCDLNMPEMDGVEFLRHLADATFGGALILVSGEDPRVLSTAEKLARAHSLTVLGAVAKPR